MNRAPTCCRWRTPPRPALRLGACTLLANIAAFLDARTDPNSQHLLFGRWVAIALTTVVGVHAYAALAVMLHLSGTRTASNCSASDFVVTVALGSTLAMVLMSQQGAITSLFVRCGCVRASRSGERRSGSTVASSSARRCGASASRLARHRPRRATTRWRRSRRPRRWCSTQTAPSPLCGAPVGERSTLAGVRGFPAPGRRGNATWRHRGRPPDLYPVILTRVDISQA